MMRSTEDAVARGLRAGEAERARWRRLRPVYGRHSREALARGRYDLAIVMAVQAQLCGEALEAEEIAGELEAGADFGELSRAVTGPTKVRKGGERI